MGVMMAGVELVPLLVAVSVCLLLAAAGNAWVGDALKTWYPGLVKPRLLAPLWAFIAVGVAVYVLEGVVLYRLLVFVLTPEGKVVAVTALLVVMVSNEAWNYAFFGMRSTLAALVGIVGFLAPLTVLMVALFAYEVVSGWLLLPYCLWVMYDVGWVYQLWRLNPDRTAAPGATPDHGGG
jgi:tryptophan-rich sensory protein